jgi:hypothetical protein
MTDDDRAQLQRMERLLDELKSAGEKRDARVDLVNNRVIGVGGLLFGVASLAVIFGAAYIVNRADGDVVQIVVCVIFGLGLFLTIRSASKEFFRDPLVEQERREINAQRVKDGLEPIRDPTFWETVGGYLLLLVFISVFVAIVGGIGAIAADLLFYSKTFGPIAQLGLAATLGGFICIGLISATSEGIGKLINWRKSRRKAKR